MARSEAQPDRASGARRAPGGITLRALMIGLLMVGVIVGMTQALSIRYAVADVGGNAPPAAPIYLLLAYVLLAAFLPWLRSRFGLSRGELLLIYAMMLVAGPITHPHAIGFLVPHTVAPAYYGAQQSSWALFQPTLPAWLSPQDRNAVEGFFHGTGGNVPWHAWLVPMLAWSSLLIALFFVMLCINTLMRRQWIESERLTFPLAAIPLTLTEGDKGVGERLRHTLRQPLFWLGVALPLALQASTEIHNYYPSVPAFPLRDVIILNSPSAPLVPPWNGLGQVSFSLIFWLVGVAYLLPKEIAFSAWVFYLIRLLEDVLAVWLGKTGEAPSVYSNDFPAVFAQGAGAALALTGITLFAARRHLARAIRKAFRGDPTLDDRGEFLSYRTAVWGTALGIAFILAWCCVAGMRLWVAALLFGLMLAYFFIFARIRAETGLGMGVIVWPKMLDEMMLTFVGARYMTLSDLTMVHALRWLYFGSATGSVMAAQMEGFKLTDAGGLPRRSVGSTILLTMLLTVPVAFAWTLKTYYHSGFEAMPIGQREPSMVASQIYWSFQGIVYENSAPHGPELGGLLAIGAGALITIALHWMRTCFLWFPLHPVGYLAANSWGMHINWASFFLGWLLKTLLTRYGGLSVYARLLPLFLGLIVGDMLHQGLWGLVAWASGGAGVVRF